MRPDLQLGDLYGRDVAYCPGASYVAPGWLQGSRGVRDFRTGDPFAIAGSLPFVCSRAVATPEALALLDEAGVGTPRERRMYGGPGEYARVLADLGRAGPIAFQHVHAEKEFDAARYRIPRDLLSSLNNKANLGQLVPAEHVPSRRVVALEDIRSGRETIAPPVVLKAATDEPTGGGRDVRICLGAEAIAPALSYLGRCRSVVVEELLEMERSLCVQYAVLADGEVRHIGFAEQIVNEEGRYLGNWLDVEDRAPEDVLRIGQEIAQAAASRGYRGIAGFDVGLCRDGRHLFFDLNFRLNGSTTAVLLMREAAKRLQVPRMRYRSWESHAPDALLVAARQAVAQGSLVPLAFYDPRAVGATDEPARLSGLSRSTVDLLS